MKLDKELPERVAERELQDAKAKFAQAKQDMLLIQQWHLSTIAPRMVESHKRALECGSGYSTGHPTEREVLFCDLKNSTEHKINDILDVKESLVKTWYKQKHGLKNVCFRYNQRETMRYMQFDFHSPRMEAELRTQSLKGRSDYDAAIQIALSLICNKGQLNVQILNIIKSFIPDYIEHLRQEKTSFENAFPW